VEGSPGRGGRAQVSLGISRYAGEPRPGCPVRISSIRPLHTAPSIIGDLLASATRRQLQHLPVRRSRCRNQFPLDLSFTRSGRLLLEDTAGGHTGRRQENVRDYVEGAGVSWVPGSVGFGAGIARIARRNQRHRTISPGAEYNQRYCLEVYSERIPTFITGLPRR